MEWKINRRIAEHVTEVYISEDGLQRDAFDIDCGEGVNVWQLPGEKIEDIRHIDPDMIRDYPHTPGLKTAIARFWGAYTNLPKEAVFISEGSMGGIRLACMAILEQGDKVLGNIPSFNAAASEISLWGTEYDGLLLPEEDGFKFNADKMIGKISDTYKMIYIDNPNNPTGQIIPIEEIRRIVEKAAEFGIGVVVDEAYGDYMENENSAVKLADSYDNVIVLRTFSKGMAMGGLRVGYMIAGSGFIGVLSQVCDAYSVSSISRIMAEKEIEDGEFIRSVRQFTIRIKQQFTRREWKNLSFAETADVVPIMMVSHKNRNIDLAKVFAEYRIKVISGASFRGIDANAVRFRIPREQELERVLAAFNEIDKLK